MELDIWHGGLGWPECLPASPRGGQYERAEVSGGCSLGGGLEDPVLLLPGPASLQYLNPLANGLYSIFS